MEAVAKKDLVQTLNAKLGVPIGQGGRLVDALDDGYLVVQLGAQIGLVDVHRHVGHGAFPVVGIVAAVVRLARVTVENAVAPGAVLVPVFVVRVLAVVFVGLVVTVGEVDDKVLLALAALRADRTVVGVIEHQ